MKTPLLSILTAGLSVILLPQCSNTPCALCGPGYTPSNGLGTNRSTARRQGYRTAQEDVIRGLRCDPGWHAGEVTPHLLAAFNEGYAAGCHAMGACPPPDLIHSGK